MLFDFLGKAEKDRERYIREKGEFQQKLKDEKNGIMMEKVDKPPVDSEDEIEEDMEEEPDESD